MTKKEKKINANEPTPQIIADQAMPLESVIQDILANGAISSGVTINGAALGVTGAIEEAGELRDMVETRCEMNANAFADDAMTSTVSSISIV
jgi:hypothetical protein